MAKAKKKSWGVDLNQTEDAAKNVIQTTSHSKSSPAQPASRVKKKPGPKGQEEEIVRVQILVSSHKKLKKLAALADMKQLEYLSKLVNEEYEKNTK